MCSSTNVIIIDHNHDLATQYATWLDSDYAVKTVHDTPSKINWADESVDAVLLNHQMPGVLSDNILENIRTESPNCGAGMITAVRPNFDIIEMGFDAYLTKPVTESKLNDVVDRLLLRCEYIEKVQKYFMRLSQREALLAELPESKLESDERFQDLKREIEKLREDLSGYVTELGDDDFEALFHRIDA